MKLELDLKRKIGTTEDLVYGQFIEHFHRQIYGGIYDPGSFCLIL